MATIRKFQKAQGGKKVQTTVKSDSSLYNKIKKYSDTTNFPISKKLENIKSKYPKIGNYKISPGKFGESREVPSPGKFGEENNKKVMLKKGGSIKKAQDGNKTPSSPKFPLKSRGEVSPYYKAEQEANKKKGFEKGTYTAPKFKNKMDSIKSEFKGAYGMRKGGSVKRMQAGGVAGKSPKAGMVDPRGAYTKVQTRTLGNMKSGGKMSKKK